MKWIVVAILVCVVPYTWLTLRYRKPNPAYQPYHDTKERAQVKRLLDAQIRRLSLDFQPLDTAPSASPHATNTAEGGVPTVLRDVLIDTPNLPASITQVWTSRQPGQTAPLLVDFAFTTRHDSRRLVRVHAYLHEGRLAVIPELDHADAESGLTTHTAHARVEIPPGMLNPGTPVTLVGAAASREWTLPAQP